MSDVSVFGGGDGGEWRKNHEIGAALVRDQITRNDLSPFVRPVVRIITHSQHYHQYESVITDMLHKLREKKRKYLLRQQRKVYVV